VVTKHFYVKSFKERRLVVAKHFCVKSFKKKHSQLLVIYVQKSHEAHGKHLALLCEIIKK